MVQFQLVSYYFLLLFHKSIVDSIRSRLAFSLNLVLVCVTCLLQLLCNKLLLSNLDLVYAICKLRVDFRLLVC